MRRTHAYILRRLVGFLTITTSVVVAFTTRPSSLFLHKKRQPATERFLPTRNSRPSTLARSLINERDDATISVPGEYYPIADDPDYDSVSAAWSDRPPRYDAAWFTIVFVPILTPIVAFLTYDCKKTLSYLLTPNLQVMRLTIFFCFHTKRCRGDL
jgi:hypothetical protein